MIQINPLDGKVYFGEKKKKSNWNFVVYPHSS